MSSYGDDPVRLDESLAAVMKSLRPDTARPTSVTAPTAAAMGGVFGRWAEAVGDAVAAHVQPVRLDGDRLVVEVDDPAWATQIRFLESTMIARLNEVSGAEIVSLDVKVKPRR